MRPIAVTACFICAIETYRSAVSITSHAHEILGWLNMPVGLTCAALWIVSGTYIAFYGTEERS
jgi:hypothetical protein